MTCDAPYILTSQEFATAAGISERKARKALRRCLEGGTWRGNKMEVSVWRGRGGKSGHGYYVRLNSLPPELQQRALELYPALAPAPPAAPISQPVVIAGRELVPAARRALIRPRLPRSDKWEKRVFLSREWDRAMAFLDHDAKRRIAEETARDVLSLWSTDQRGWRNIARLALPELMKVTRAAGFVGDDDMLKAICMLPRGFIDRERGRGLAIARHEKDAKAHSDRQPRIRRDYSALRPGELIIGDVHPMDMIYPRADGSIATAKLIAWLDARSNFLIGHPIFLAKGEGVRMEHVALSFARMVVEYGFMAERLLLDNGKEYNWTEFVECLMRLIHDAKVPLTGVNDRRARTIIKALPYNAPAKKIEAIFRVIEQTVFRAFPGWIGGDRMAKKTHNVGRAPEPFPGSEREHWNAIQAGITFYNTRPQDGLGGLAPVDIFAQRDRCAVDITDLQTAFARERVKSLHRQTFRHENVVYRHNALDARPDLERVLVRVPVFGGHDRLPVFEPNGEFICHAEPDTAYHALDQAGAIESARRKASARAAIREWSGDRRKVDILDRMDAFVALNPAPAEREPAATLALTGEMKRAADDRRRIDQNGGPALPKPDDRPVREDPLERLMRASNRS